MPRIKSAIKRVEVAKRNRERNLPWRSAVRTVRNKVTQACGEADAKTAAEMLRNAYKVIDMAVSKGILHKKNAARKKSALAKLTIQQKTAKKKRA